MMIEENYQEKTMRNDTVLLRRTLSPGKEKSIKVKADDTFTVLAEVDCLGVYLWDRRSGGKHHLLSWELLEQLRQQVTTRGGAA
jgi:hypothetical protein